MPRPRLLAALSGLTLAGLVGSCVSMKPAAVAYKPDPQRPHHTAKGFQNLHVPFRPKGWLTVLQWQWDAVRNGLPPPPSTPTPRVTPALDFIASNARAGRSMEPAVIWLGHSTVLAQIGGLNLLTDPVFSERASPSRTIGPKRAQPPALRLDELPKIDLVLVSHNHYDHLDEASVRALAAQPGGSPLFVVPLGLKAWFAARGITRVEELDWWQTLTVPDASGRVEVVLTPAQHWSARTLTDRMQTLWGGFAVFAPDCHLIYTGDTGYSPDFAEIKRRFAGRQQDGGFDLALIPIGAYEPRWFMRDQHVNPAESVQIHRDLGAQRSLGVHWGTFNLTDEALDEPPKALAAARQQQGLREEEFFVLALGETRRLPRRAQRAVQAAPEASSVW